MRTMTRIDALKQIIRDARFESTYLDEYKRTKRALVALDCTDEEVMYLLGWLDYLDTEGKPYPQLQAKMDKEEEKKRERKANNKADAVR